jgi:hypothetical protein
VKIAKYEESGREFFRILRASFTAYHWGHQARCRPNRCQRVTCRWLACCATQLKPLLQVPDRQAPILRPTELGNFRQSIFMLVALDPDSSEAGLDVLGESRCECHKTFLRGMREFLRPARATAAKRQKGNTLGKKTGNFERLAQRLSSWASNLAIC